MSNNPQPLSIWNKFCSRFDIADLSVPLFESDSKCRVVTRNVGRDERPVLVRSSSMEQLVISQVDQLTKDYLSREHRFDGLIYMMGYKRSNEFTPLYIGKTETLGKGEGNLSANILNIRTDRSKFARWGDNYAYHIGDLSACVLKGHKPEKVTLKYQSWAKTIFETDATGQPRLRETVHFWAKAWDNQDAGIWQELGPTSLAFLEYMLIGVASKTTKLLNREGISRR
jgi:hypothetical protein